MNSFGTSLLSRDISLASASSSRCRRGRDLDRLDVALERPRERAADRAFDRLLEALRRCPCPLLSVRSTLSVSPTSRRPHPRALAGGRVRAAARRPRRTLAPVLAFPGWSEGPSPSDRARVAERQTRWLQVPVSARAWGFKSPLAHHLRTGPSGPVLVLSRRGVPRRGRPLRGPAVRASDAAECCGPGPCARPDGRRLTRGPRRGGVDGGLLGAVDATTSRVAGPFPGGRDRIRTGSVGGGSREQDRADEGREDMNIEEFLLSDVRYAVERRPAADALRELDALRSRAGGPPHERRRRAVRGFFWTAGGRCRSREANTAVSSCSGGSTTAPGGCRPRERSPGRRSSTGRVSEVGGGIEPSIGLLAGGDVVGESPGGRVLRR